ncbi:MAG: hypothetical protein ACM3UO_00120 [Bacillota bacterium]
MTYEIDQKPVHDEIAKFINKEQGKRLSGEQVALVLDGAKAFRATARERAEAARNEKRAAKIAALKAQLAALTGDEPKAAPAKEATVTPIKPKGAAKKAAANKPKAESHNPEPAEDEMDISLTPEGAEPIEVLVSDDSFHAQQTEADDDEWDTAFGDDSGDSEVEDF